VIIHGDVVGLDRLAGQWAVNKSLKVERYPADWAKHRRAAGPIRNKQMLDESKPDLVVAFPGGGGTANTVKQAREAGVPVMVIADAC
jgi:ABC-type Fe3+-hydroxamate transport system substrate-binding protein